MTSRMKWLVGILVLVLVFAVGYFSTGALSQGRLMLNRNINSGVFSRASTWTQVFKVSGDETTVTVQSGNVQNLLARAKVGSDFKVLYDQNCNGMDAETFNCAEVYTLYDPLGGSFDGRFTCVSSAYAYPVKGRVDSFVGGNYFNYGLYDGVHSTLYILQGVGRGNNNLIEDRGCFTVFYK